MSEQQVPLTTPVIVGVGQVVDPIDDPSYRAFSPVDLGAEAARAALEDSGADLAAALDALGTLVVTRTFADSIPTSMAPLGRSDNPPRSVAERIGADPRRAIYDATGGQTPQALVRELCQEIAAGREELALLVSGEAISTERHARTLDDKPSFAEHVDGSMEDRGLGLSGMVTRHHVEHGLVDTTSQYALFEHARRARLGLTREELAQQMGDVFAPFTRVAADNPLAADRDEHTGEELTTVADGNRMIADPYTRRLVARDQVNLGAAVLIMSYGKALELGVHPSRLVFLHGTSSLRELPSFERPDLGANPAAVAAVEHALEVAGTSVDDVRWWDLYSCYPIAVLAVCDGLGLSPQDPRGLTVTGGLPYFGGPGNGYSMHAIAEVVERVRADGTVGLVGANGGLLSKYAVGVYSTEPRPWRDDDSTRLQAELDAGPRVDLAGRADGWATIETYTVLHPRTGPKPVVVGRLESDGRRFVALPDRSDPGIVALLDGETDPIGHRVYVHGKGQGNRVATTPAPFAKQPPAFQESYEFIRVERKDRVLEITLDRPESRNALHPPAHEELEGVLDAFLADGDLWAAIITGAGDGFCAGNDLAYTASGAQPYFPRTGFAGLTSRKDVHKPIIAAVNGHAMGGGLEIVLACHLAVADERAKLGVPEVGVGLVAAAGGLVRLPRTVPKKVAHEMLLAGRRLSAAEAHELGLVNEVAPAGGALEAARALAERVVAGSPSSVRLSLRAMDLAEDVPDTVDAITRAEEVLDDLLVSADTWEGVMAFVEKRTPQWKGY